MEQPVMRGPRRDAGPPAFNVPRVVLGLIGLLISVHLVRLALPQSADFWVLMAFSFIPARFAAAVDIAFPGGVAGDVWSWATYALLHADAMHLLVNCFWLAAFGSALAKRFGAMRFLAVTWFAAIGGAAAYLALRWGELAPMIGASAAISGHMGAVIRFAFSGPGGIGAAFPGDERHLKHPAPPLGVALRNRSVITFLAVWFGINLLLGIGAVGLPGDAGGVAWEAHIGGFLVGLATFGLFDPIEKGGNPRSGRKDRLRLVAESEPEWGDRHEDRDG